jgi:hypothetical protein
LSDPSDQQSQPGGGWTPVNHQAPGLSIGWEMSAEIDSSSRFKMKGVPVNMGVLRSRFNHPSPILLLFDAEPYQRDEGLTFINARLENNLPVAPVGKAQQNLANGRLA